ncbi:hypothetical protein [Shewanella surugensis]|uniref:Flagellin n=1 Tax=Shewanella surugensis TaxID=212020 RepID=A0ABT0LE41_9GAMM|nr:hypothetical protein [Shewanella surugensis]MCL1125973.1 hypothetical protein [Shewanella surugensis]
MGYSQGVDETGSNSAQVKSKTINGIKFTTNNFYSVTYGTKNYVTLGAYSSGTLGAEAGISVTASLNLYTFLRLSLSLWKFGTTNDYLEVRATIKQEAVADKKEATAKTSKAIFQQWETVSAKVTNIFAITNVNGNRLQSIVSHQQQVLNKANVARTNISTTATANQFISGLQRQVSQKARSVINQTSIVQSQLDKTSSVITAANVGSITCSNLMML